MNAETGGAAAETPSRQLRLTRFPWTKTVSRSRSCVPPKRTASPWTSIRPLCYTIADHKGSHLTLPASCDMFGHQRRSRELVVPPRGGARRRLRGANPTAAAPYGQRQQPPGPQHPARGAVHRTDAISARGTGLFRTPLTPRSGQGVTHIVGRRCPRRLAVPPRPAQDSALGGTR